MLEVQHLTVRYGRVDALRSVSLDVKQGELVAVVGPNGAGKSSLLNTVAGRTRAASGEVKFTRQSISTLAPEDIVRRGLALVPEGRHIFHTLTVRENLTLGAMVTNGGSSVERAYEWAAERFPILGQYLDVPAGKLSGGEQQQLAIARAMVGHPQMLMLDEPSLGLAPMIVDEVFALLGELHREGTTILLVEQNATRALALADRAYVLKSGRFVFEGRREELHQAGTKLTSAYLGE